MIIDRSHKDADIGATAGCTVRAVRRIRTNLWHFNSTKAPPNGAGRPRRMTPFMLDALREKLVDKPGMYLDEMSDFICDEFHVLVKPSTISRALARVGWSKKTARQEARERNADLRDFYIHNLSAFRSYQLVYIDESGCDKRVGFRRTGWSPLGTAPVQTTRFHRGNRYQILPAYCQDGILVSRVFQCSTDSVVFEDFIQQVLQHCRPWPESKSVLIMDNASFHHSERIKQMCADAGVKLLYLPPYSPDLNPIEIFFGRLKAFIKKRWQEYEEDPSQDFGSWLQWCIDVVGGRASHAEAHFRHAGVCIEKA